MWDYFLCVILLTIPVLSQQQNQQSQTFSNNPTNGNNQQSQTFSNNPTNGNNQQLQTFSNNPTNGNNQQSQTISNQPTNGNNQETGPLKKPVKDGTPYQVTENIADRPDDRTLAPIDPTYGINVPLNLGNNNNIKNGYSVTENPENDEKDTTEKIKLKKNTFSYVQIKGEFDDNLQIQNFIPNYGQGVESGQNNIGFKRFLDGIKSYIFSMKKGLVDGLHNWYNKNSINNQARKEIDEFYRSFHDDSDSDEGSGEIVNWLNKEDVQKEILKIYKSLNDDSSEEGIEVGDDSNSDENSDNNSDDNSDDNSDESSDDKYRSHDDDSTSGDDYSDYHDHPHFHHHHHHHHNHKRHAHKGK